MKKMKKSILALAGATILSLALFSCADDESDYNYELNNATVNFMLGTNVLSYDTTFTYSDSMLIDSTNESYSKEIANFACALAFDCYDTAKVSMKTSETNPVSAYDNTTLYKNFDLEDATEIKLSAEDYLSDKDDLTSAVFANKTVTSGDKKYQIFTMAVQGSSGQAQWQSNFDVGDFSGTTYATLSATHSIAVATKVGITDTASVQAESTANYTALATSFATEHKGFALAAKRLNEKFNSYVSEKEDSEADKIILLTGHSRGAAIANILGKIYEDDENWKSFAYTFATPRTTTNENASSYKTIFNIINEDDLVTELPLGKWGFTRYGTDKKGSIASSYIAQWKNKLPLVSSYVSANGQDTSYLESVATDRADLYKLTDASTAASNVFKLSFDMEEEANTKLAYLNAYGFGVEYYDPYSTFAVAQDSGTQKYVLSGTFRPQFFLNTLVMSICLASVSTEKTTEFVMTMCTGFQPVHSIALLKMASNATGFAYSHSAPCYTILAENLPE